MCARCLERNLKPEKVRLLETKHKRRHRFLVLQHHIIETLNVCIALSCFSPLHFMTLSRDLFENISSATRLDNPSSFNTPPLGRETRNPSRRESSGWRHVYSIRRWFIWSGMCNLHQKWKDNCSSFLFIFTKRHFFVFRPRMLIANVKCHKVLEWICSSAPDVQRLIIIASVPVVSLQTEQKVTGAKTLRFTLQKKWNNTHFYNERKKNKTWRYRHPVEWERLAWARLAEIRNISISLAECSHTHAHAKKQKKHTWNVGTKQNKTK